jgi:hypothetical protein
MAIKNFTAGAILTASDTNTFLNSAGLVLITSGITVSSSGGTAATINNGTVTIGTNNSSVTLSNCFNSTYDNYKVVVSGGVGSAAGDAGLQLTGITTSVYQTNGFTMNTGSNVLAGFGNTATTSWPVGSINATRYSYSFDLIAPFVAQQKFMLNMVGMSTTGYYQLSGLCTSTTSATGFSITGNGGLSMTGGTIQVFGYRKV